MAIDSTVARTSASLLVRTAEMRVGYLLTRYRQAKADCEGLEVLLVVCLVLLNI